MYEQFINRFSYKPVKIVRILANYKNKKKKDDDYFFCEQYDNQLLLYIGLLTTFIEEKLNKSGGQTN